ncbi:MAG: homoserine dehydrogenase, partial [Planctomycetes bacterium]|nr:homoserine dehydrogenase [Planctomycetota bacterium]
MVKTIGISILGCGAVGSATAELLLKRRADYAKRCGVDLQLRSIVVRDGGKPRPAGIDPSLLTTDMRRAIEDTSTHIVIELMGGTTAALDAIDLAIRSGKDVVTANKALLALHGPEVFAAARSAGRCIAFEAAVGGGIPLVESIRRGLVANEIEAVHGILNGTCNYILTRMSDSKVAYAEALTEAQRLGYAEADPTLDVEGIDSAHKLAIVASLAMRRGCDFGRILHRGITDIEVTDLTAGEELGFVCKLLAAGRRHRDGIDLSVQPTFIRASHPLASVRGPFNALSL